MIVPLVLRLPVHWIERRQGPDALRVPTSTARLVELPPFAARLGVAAAVAWSDHLGGHLNIAALLCACITAWAIAAPLVLRARHRPRAAQPELG